MSVWNSKSNICACGSRVVFGKDTVRCPGCGQEWRLLNSRVA